MLKECVVIGAVALSARLSAEPIIYAAEAASGRIVTVNALTGAVTNIGTLSLPPAQGAITDLASHSGRLFGLVSRFPFDARIIEISPSDASILSNALVTIGGVTASEAIEGLAADANGNLIISLWRPGLSTSTSAWLGTVALTGEVTNLSFAGTNADFDGLGSDPAGGFVGLDRDPDTSTVILTNVSYPPASFSAITTFPFSPGFNFVDDIAVLDGQILTIDRNPQRLNRHNRATGAIVSSVNYTPTYTLQLLAVVNPPACPGDINGDGMVGLGDIAVLIQNWTFTVPPAPASADLDGSGDVGLGDIAVVIQYWGTVCP